MNRPDSLTLRPAHVHEASAMAAMSRELIETGLGWRYTPLRMAALVTDAETVALVACDAARIRGFAVMQFGDDRAHLVLMCVQPDQQRRSIGRRLHEWLVESARVAGIASIQLELRADNAGALAFYGRLGFVEVGWVPGYYNNQIAARRMERLLRADDAAR